MCLADTHNCSQICADGWCDSLSFWLACWFSCWGFRFWAIHVLAMQATICKWMEWLVFHVVATVFGSKLRYDCFVIYFIYLFIVYLISYSLVNSFSFVLFLYFFVIRELLFFSLIVIVRS
jgi:hypothetical protein